MTLPLSPTGCGLLRAVYFLWQDKGEAVQELKEGGLSNPTPTAVVGVAGHLKGQARAIPSIVAIHSF